MNTLGDTAELAIDDVLVLIHAARPAAVRSADSIVAWLEERAGSVRVEEDALRFCAQRKAAHESGGSVDSSPSLLVVLGGDGTILGAARAFADDPAPTVGINFGHVGFLASTPQTRWRETLVSVFDGTARIERRMRIEASWGSHGDSVVALNEVVLQRGSNQRMLTAAMRVGEDEVTDYRADGLIIATPSGSTAYSLSAGGPILEPTLHGFVVTPICSQGLANRPLVLNAENTVSVLVTNEDGPTSLTADGQAAFELESGQVLEVRRCAQPFPLVAMPGLDPFRRLRERLGWSGGPTVISND